MLHGCLLSLSRAGVYNADFFATRGRLPSFARFGRARRPSPHTHTHTSSVQWRLAWGARFPAAVHPEPLVGIAADEVFYDFRESCGVGYYVGFVIVGAN